MSWQKCPKDDKNSFLFLRNFPVLGDWLGLDLTLLKHRKFLQFLDEQKLPPTPIFDDS
jgi:hypothetical protein